MDASPSAAATLASLEQHASRARQRLRRLLEAASVAAQEQVVADAELDALLRTSGGEAAQQQAAITALQARHEEVQALVREGALAKLRRALQQQGSAADLLRTLVLQERAVASLLSEEDRRAVWASVPSARQAWDALSRELGGSPVSSAELQAELQAHEEGDGGGGAGGGAVAAAGAEAMDAQGGEVERIELDQEEEDEEPGDQVEALGMRAWAAGVERQR